jgi:membrane protease YdiL (CAAX protease family)
MLGQQGAYLAQGYMLTPAIAAILTRLFFYKPRFKDANLRFGRFKDYIRFWLISIGITALSYALFTLLGSITWDLSGKAFLDRLTQQLATAGQDINASLPPGFTPHMMLIIFTVAGLTVFNIIPGIITGFGEEFGHRGFMFPLLYRIKPWIGIIVGGLIWYAWHLPLMLVIPQTVEYSLWQMILNFIILAIGSVCTFTYLAYVYVKSESVWVTSVAHITMNNVAASFSYYVIVQNQVLANIGLTLTMIFVVAILYYRKELNIFREYFNRKSSQEVTPECLHSQSDYTS